jgi:uncharacterized membrane protein YgaE (UPF0421/DUF939 family)
VDEPPRTFSARAQPLIEEAAERSRLSARIRAERLRDAARAILQATLAATLAWVAATELVGHSQPFFAPVSAMITLGLTQGQRGRRAVEVVLGVTLGIAVADLLVIELGTGWWQLALVVALSMSAALLLGSGQMFAQQAAVSAALVATLQPPDGGVSFARAVDALLGGGIALAVSALVLPAHPERMVRGAAEPVLAELAAVLEDVAAALERRDRTAAQAALDRGRAIDELARELETALVAGRETARLAPPRRRALQTVDVYTDAAAQLDLAIRNVRVLARGVAGDRPRGERPAGDRRRAAGTRRGRARPRGCDREPGPRASGPRARAAGGGGGDARARAHRQPLRLGDRRPGAVDGGRSAARVRDVVRGGRGGGARGGAGGGVGGSRGVGVRQLRL